MGAWRTPREGRRAATLPILTQIRVFVKTKIGSLLASERFLQGLREPAAPKLIPRCLRLIRHRFSAVKQQLGLRTERQAKQRSWRGEPGRPMQDAADLFRHLNLAPDIRGDGVDRSGQPLVLEPESIESHDVIDVNPSEPLTAVAERAADE